MRPLVLVLSGLSCAALPVSAQGVAIAPPPMQMIAAPTEVSAAEPGYDVDLSGPPTFRGTLTNQDPTRDGGTAYDSYTFDVREGDEVTVTMSSDDFDTFLIVRAPGGRERSNDDFGSTRVSQVAFNATTGGAHTVIATAYSSDARGDYEVRVESTRATVVSTTSGRLDYQDAQQIKGDYYDQVGIRPPSSGEFYVDLLPLGFQGYLCVTSPSGVQTRADGSTQSSGGAVRLGPLQAEQGTWTVDVTSTGEAGQVGAYDLRVITMDSRQ